MIAIELSIGVKALGAASSSGYREPRQERSRKRFDAILDAAAALLEDKEPDDISVYTLAESSGVPPASIYHFFPDASLVFVALAERYYREFVRDMDSDPPAGIASWQELHAFRFSEARDRFNERKAARRLLLGSGLSATIRARDLEVDRQLAELSALELTKLFAIPEIPNLVDRLTEMLVVNDAIWTLSVHRHGYITTELDEQARRAREAYTRTFLPEYAPLRDQAQPQAASDT